MDCEATTAKIGSSDILSSGSDDIVEDNDVVPKIKLKLSNAGGPSSSLNPMARVCDYCGKEFSNGKALGGHIRIHTQALRKQGMLKLQPGSRNEENNNNNNVCPICNRVFPSVKSLFGHMRFHNVRSSLSSSSSSSSDKEEEEDGEIKAKKKIMVSSIDLLKDLPNWSRTDKRGRGSTCEAARNLISLASAGRISETLAESTFRKKKHDIIDRKGKALVLSSSSSSCKDNGQPQPQPQPGRGRRRIRFMCSTCGRVFPTFQALGGHRSSHNKDKKTSLLVSRRDNNLINISRQNHRTGQSESSASTELAAPHRCDICRKNFPSGQSLGGHKRCHWGAPNITGSASNAINHDEASPDSAAFRQDPMDIDLNKLPSMEMDVHQDK